MRLAGTVGLVTGASRGIGREVAKALAGEGMALALVSRTASELEELASGLGTAIACPCDVRDPDAVLDVVARLERELGPVDLLVNDAATIEPVERPFWEVDAQESWDVVETNLRGPMQLCRAVLPGMVDRGSGRVVNLTSRARAAQRTGTYTAYAVSKRALTAFTEAVAVPLAGTGVAVVDVLPGLVRTPMTERMPVWRDVPPPDWAPAEATAQLVVDVALGRHDDRSGEMLDAVALHRR